MLFPITLLICSVSAVQGYSSGAGDAVCDRALEPGHGATSKDADSSPYSIKADASQYSPNGTVDVTLTATGTKFAGFYVAAYAPTDVNFTTTIGKMSARGGTISSYTNVKCTGGITHSVSFYAARPAKVELTWTAPADAQGNVVFAMTGVQSASTYWARLKSGVIWDGQGEAPPTTTPKTVSSGGESSGGEDGGKGTGVALQASLLTLASLLIGRFL